MLVTTAACGGFGDGDRARAVVARPAEAADTDPARWVVTVDLDDDRVGGGSTVQIAFDSSEFSCVEGHAIDASALLVGSPLTFVRVGDDFDAMSPPIIGARDVTAECP
jgi:hypothetical protein